MLSKFYDRYWQAPDLYNMNDLAQDPWTARRVRMFLGKLPSKQRVADVGCGTGGGTALMREAGHDATGIDVSPAAVEAARATYPRIPFFVASLEDGQCHLPDASFDAVFAGEVIEHVYDVDAFLRELHRLIRPGGTLAVTTPYNGVIKTLLIVLTGRFDVNFDPRGPHIRFFTTRAIRKALRDNGFEPTDVSFHGRFAPIWNGMMVVARRQS